MPDQMLATQFGTELSRREQNLRAAILRIVDDHASRGFSSLQGPAVGRIIETCDQALEQAYEVALKLLQEHSTRHGVDERAQLVLAFLPQVEQRLARLAATPASYIESLNGVTPPELASRVPMFLSRLKRLADPTL